ASGSSGVEVVPPRVREGWLPPVQRPPAKSGAWSSFLTSPEWDGIRGYPGSRNTRTASVSTTKQKGSEFASLTRFSLRARRVHSRFPDAHQDRRARIADLHHKVDRHVGQHADRHVLDRLRVGRRLEDEMALAGAAEQAFTLAGYDGHAGRQR